MAWLEQIPVTGETNEDQGQKGAPATEVADANLQTEGNNNEVVTDSAVVSNQEIKESLVSALSTEQAEEESTQAVNNPETMKQINQLVDLWNKYKNWELKDVQKEQYENLMTTLKAELDKNVPTVIEMNQEIDVNYYNEHPEEAEKKADEITNDYNNMNDVDLVSNVVSRSDYLWQESKQKLYNVIQEFNSDITAVLSANQKENNSEE